VIALRASFLVIPSEARDLLLHVVLAPLHPRGGFPSLPRGLGGVARATHRGLTGSTTWRLSFLPLGFRDLQRLLAPARCALKLLGRDRAGTPRGGAPRCSPPSQTALGRGQRDPTAGRPLGARGLRSECRSTRGAGVEDPPPATWKGLAAESRTRAGKEDLQDLRIVGGVGANRPVGRGDMAPDRAGTERPERRVETLAPTERSMRGRGT
jgi:hypothetical protein